MALTRCSRPRCSDLPFLRRDDARDDVEGDQALLRLGVAVDRKGDADAPEQQFRLAPAEIEHVRFDLGEPLRQFGIGRPHGVAAAPHFVEHVEPRPAPAINVCGTATCSKLRANSNARRHGLVASQFSFIAHVLGGLTIGTADREPRELLPVNRAGSQIMLEPILIVGIVMACTAWYVQHKWRRRVARWRKCGTRLAIPVGLSSWPGAMRGARSTARNISKSATIFWPRPPYRKASPEPLHSRLSRCLLEPALPAG